MVAFRLTSTPVLALACKTFRGLAFTSRVLGKWPLDFLLITLSVFNLSACQSLYSRADVSVDYVSSFRALGLRGRKLCTHDLPLPLLILDKFDHF